MSDYGVDVDELAAVIAAMGSCGQDLADLATEVEAAQGVLHAEWARLASKPGWLRAHDAPPGHTVREHVSKTAEELRERVVTEGRRRASSFDDLASAEKAVDQVLARYSDEITDWVRSGSSDKLVPDMQMAGRTGTTVLADGSMVGSSSVRLVLIRKPGTDEGWQVLTAFPN